jgi:GntR family transcriptional regulator
MTETYSNESTYVRLQRELGEMIASAKAGDQLPTEPELAKQMGVSRSTLREAMRSFETQGLLIRRQGSGTFVADTSRIFETGLEALESLETIAERLGLEISMSRLDIGRQPADSRFSSLFDVPPRTELLNISRVIYVKGQPAAYLQDILPEENLGAQDLRNGFTGSILDLLIEKKSPELEQSSTEIKVIPAPPDVARSLDIQRGEGLLMFEADLVTRNGKVIDHSYSYFLPGYFRFHVVRKIGVS